MKNLFLLCLLFISVNAFAQNEEADEVKRTLLEMFELMEDEQDVPLARYIVYRGKDEVRKWKDVCNVNETDEYLRVKMTRLRIQKQFLPYKYEFVKFHTEKESEGIWYVWEMKYNKDGEDKKMFFAFLKIKGKYTLGDID